MVMITVPHSSFLPFLFALFSFTPFPLSELFAADSGEEKLSEQVEELLSEDVKNQKANSDENLNSQHKKTASIVIIIVILLILLWNIPMRRSKKLRKGERGEGEQSK